MQVKVTKNKVILPEGYIINRNEYKANPLEFVFSEEYTDELVKKAIFVNGDIAIEQAIINNTCNIPYEVLDVKSFELRVYAYEVEDEELILRYSPTYAIVYLREGSYRGNTGSGEEITPTQFEQYEQALNDGLVEVSRVDIDVSKEDSTATVTITNRDNETKSVEIHDGEQGPQGPAGKDGEDYIITEDDYNDIADIVEEQIEIPTKTSDLTNDSGFIDKDVNNLTNYTLKTNTGSLIDLEINQSNYVVSLKLKDINGNVISSDNIDLPLESVVVGGSYDATNKKIVLTLENGNTVDIPVGDLIAGLQTEITSQNKLASDLVDDTNQTNKFVTTTEKSNWNNKLDESDLSDYVKKTDYATSEKGGTIRTSNASGLGISNGNLYAVTKAYNTYNSASNNMFISKGTLENVITGKKLYSKPSGGIPKTDLASDVQTSLGKADTAIQSHQDISGKQDKLIAGNNIVIDDNNEISENIKYSTTEKVVGTWIDNRPLYQKTIVLENTTISSSTKEMTILDITNYEIVLIKNFYINGDSSSSAGNRHKFLQNTNDSSSYCAIRGYQNNLLLQANNHKYINKAYITVQYTKTTD